MLLAIGYATVVATNPQSSHWSITLLFILLILAGVGTLTSGIIWLFQWYKNRRKGKIPSHREAVNKSQVAWGLWYTGDKMRGLKLLKTGKFKRILLLNPSPNNQSLDEHAHLVKETPWSLRQKGGHTWSNSACRPSPPG